MDLSHHLDHCYHHHTPQEHVHHHYHHFHRHICHHIRHYHLENHRLIPLLHHIHNNHYHHHLLDIHHQEHKDHHRLLVLHHHHHHHYFLVEQHLGHLYLDLQQGDHHLQGDCHLQGDRHLQGDCHLQGDWLVLEQDLKGHRVVLDQQPVPVQGVEIEFLLIQSPYLVCTECGVGDMHHQIADS